MKLIIETKKRARCVETGKTFAISNLEALRKGHEIVEDKTKPVVKLKPRAVFSVDSKKETFEKE